MHLRCAYRDRAIECGQGARECHRARAELLVEVRAESLVRCALLAWQIARHVHSLHFSLSHMECNCRGDELLLRFSPSHSTQTILDSIRVYGRARVLPSASQSRDHVSDEIVSAPHKLIAYLFHLLALVHPLCEKVRLMHSFHPNHLSN